MDFSTVRWLSFDCFGTLIDWEAGILCAARRVLEPLGVRATDDQVLERYATIEAALEAADGPYLPYRRVLLEAMRGLGRGFDVELSDTECRLLPDSLADWPAFPDTPAALRRLQSRFRIAVLSNVDNDLFAGVQPGLGIRPDALVTAEECGSYKPARRNFETLLARLGADASSLVHVAQSLYHDITPASTLGLRTVWVNRRAGRPGHGATPIPANSPRPDLHVPDLATLAGLAAPPR